MFKNLFRYMIPDFSSIDIPFIDYGTIPDCNTCTSCRDRTNVKSSRKERVQPRVMKMHRTNSNGTNINKIPDINTLYGISHQRVKTPQSGNSSSNNTPQSENTPIVSHSENTPIVSHSGNYKSQLEIFNLNAKLAKSMVSQSNEVNCKYMERYIEDYMEKTQDTWFVPGISQKLAVIFDIDDTLIDELNRPIDPVIKLYNKCREYAYVLDINGYALITIFIVTARLGEPYIMDHTERLLPSVGVDKYDKIYYRKRAEDDPEAYKLECRKHIHDRGYNTILSVGDMYWDMGEYGGKSLLIL